MKIDIKKQGGIGGIATSSHATIDTDVLSETLRQSADGWFRGDRLRPLKQNGSKHAADTATYHVEVLTGEGGKKQCYILDESALPADLLDLIDDMCAYSTKAF